MATILDHRGRPVDMSKLREPIATTELTSVRQPYFDSVTSGLTPEKLGRIIQQVDQGDPTEYLTLAEEMEERDLHYAAVLGSRKRAVSMLDITVEAVSDDKRDVQIADDVRALLSSEEFDSGDELEPGVVDGMLDALGKGFAVTEIEWDKSERQWWPKEYKYRDPRWFTFDMATRRELRLRDVADPSNGIELAPYKFIVHTPKVKTGLAIRGGLARLACVAFLCKSYTLKDWMIFAEVFGMPLRLGKYNTGATPEQKAALLRAVASIGTDASAIIPEEMVIEFVEAQGAAGGEKLFVGLADFLDKQTSKGVLGQTMTTDDGASLSQSKTHNEVRGDIRDSDAKKLAASLRRSLVRPFVVFNYGDGTELPRIKIEFKKPEDLKLLSEALPPFVALGLRVEESVVRDKFGLPEPAEDAALLRPPPAMGGFPVGPAAPTSAGEDPENEIRQTLDPTQVQELRAIMQDVAKGLLPRESAIELIVLSFPLTAEEAEKIMGPIGKDFKQPEPPAPKNPPPPPPAKTKAKPADDDEPDDEPDSLAAARRRAAIAITARIAEGAEITKEQRELLALAARDEMDDVDALADEALDDWQKVVDPVTEPILALAAKATSLDDMMKQLDAAKLDSSEMLKAIASLTFKARGLGDARDE